MNFSVNGTLAGTAESEVRIAAPGRIKVSVKAAANLDPQPNDAIRQSRYDQHPYWISSARASARRGTPVEVIVNGERAAVQNLTADGKPRTLTFDVAVDRSSWIAVRILPSSHTNPVFVLVDGKPIRGSRRSAEWCLNAVNQCWTQKASRFRASELEAARQAYEHARQVYRQRLMEAGQ